MKNILFTISLFFLTILGAFAVACTALSVNESFNPETDPVAQLVKGKLELTVSSEVLAKAVQKANPKIKSFKKYELIAATADAPAYLLIYTKLQSGINYLIAIDLEAKAAFYHINFATQGNSCTGHCCSKCQWSRPNGSLYYHCWCLIPTTTESCGTNTARCDHTLTTNKTMMIQAVK